MFLALLVLLLVVFTRPANAQIPLFYQLLEAYHPTNYSSSSNTISTAQVLGVTTTTPASSTPIAAPTNANIGGGDKVTTIALLGDSMIDTLGPDVTTLHQSLTKQFPNRSFNLLNYGVGSKDIESGLSRLTQGYDYNGKHFESLVSTNPDIVVVESFAYNNFGNTQAGIDRHWLALGAITTTIKQKLPKAKIVIAATIAPNSIVYGNGIKDLHLTSLEKIEKANTTKLYLQNAINYATSQGYPLANTYQASLSGNDGQRQYISSTDNLHPSAIGAALFSDTVVETINKHKLLEN
ncbi:MAG: SGNH/GDSL hydrolase family protein [Candidatus Shapirobacteria bacterium]|jgi:lysophospholipase L1-like esterase